MSVRKTCMPEKPEMSPLGRGGIRTARQTPYGNPFLVEPGQGRRPDYLTIQPSRRRVCRVLRSRAQAQGLSFSLDEHRAGVNTFPRSREAYHGDVRAAPEVSHRRPRHLVRGRRRAYRVSVRVHHEMGQDGRRPDEEGPRTKLEQLEVRRHAHSVLSELTNLPLR